MTRRGGTYMYSDDLARIGQHQSHPKRPQPCTSPGPSNTMPFSEFVSMDKGETRVDLLCLNIERISFTQA